MSNFTQMKTDELSRNRADRNIGITELGCILEFLGNSYGDKIFICFNSYQIIGLVELKAFEIWKR